MYNYKCGLFVALLSLSAELQSILSQNPLNSQCHVATVCNGPGGIQKQWRQVRLNGVVGDRGAPGKRVSWS